MMKTIVLCPNVHRDIGLVYTHRVKEQLDAAHVDSVIFPMFDPDGSGGGADGMALEAALRDSDLVVCFGGDGTILHTARFAARHSVPILGVNFGKMGFMAELEQDELPKIIEAVRGNFSVDERMMLDVSVIRENKLVYTDSALNDAVVSGLAALISLSVYGDGRKITGFSGDGVIICSPTGSTAYSMSAGGPIVEPGAKNIVVTPICAHTLVPKSFVLAPDRVVTVLIGKLEKKAAYLTLDGGVPFKLEIDDTVRVSKSIYTTKLARLNGRSFYEVINQKLVSRL